ncbi:nickel/cobalt ABC transporter permease [Anoxynatronum buryatiense]|uniref:Nickel import system permease protein NikB n=1 Tax=Anoxynatronum buryatiense TaxID=489973 RepID=A0AA45WWW1_9CLOT|nr:nickel/cobalt ABC transporter permease [Anoxynatronum buryatiense]SMP61618.1 nickel transport system permease protein [Anoxynatronum buryatiense]
MKQYIARRILLAIPMLLVVTFISFGLIHLIPSDPVEVALRVNEIIPTDEAIAIMREELGLDQPFFTRYASWLKQIARFDFGQSYINKNRSVSGEILRSLPATLKLAGMSFMIVVGVSIPLGIICAVYKDRLIDRAMRIFIFVATAVPNYWMGILLIWLFAVKLKILPTGGNQQSGAIILPAVTLSLTYIATYMRLIRNSMLENLTENYVYYARTRGLKEKSIIGRHVLKNSLHESIAALGMSVAQLISGTVVVENIFSWPGIGRLCISAIFNRDYPVIQAYILMMGVLFILCNLLADITQAMLDPRLQEVK